MKKLLVGAAAAAALIAPGVASADTQGAIDLTFENSDFDYGDFDSTSLGGGVATDISHNLRVQLDGRTTLQDWDNSGEYSHGYAAAHLSGDVGGFQLGGFAGIVNYYGDGGTLLGVEGRTAFGALSLDGSIGFTDFNDNNYDGTAYRLGGAYFFTPNFAITAGASATEIDTSGTDYDLTELSIGAAYQFANNIEIFGDYTDTDGDRSSGSDYDGETLQLGVRMNIGGGTLQDNANGGLWGSARHIANTWMRW